MADYSEKLLIYQDSIQTLNKSKELIDIQKKYDRQKIINEKNHMKMEKDAMIRNMLIILITIIIVSAVTIYFYQRKLIVKERMLQKKEEEINQNALKIQQNEMIIARNVSRMEELSMQIEQNRGTIAKNEEMKEQLEEQLEEQQKAFFKIEAQNAILKQENKMLQQDINKYSFSLNEKSNESKRLEILAEENQRLHAHEAFLSDLLIKDIKILSGLKNRKKPLEVLECEEIKRNINLLFDHYTLRLHNRIPSLTDSELQMCCLIKLRLSIANIADLLNISSASVSKKKLRIKDKIINELGSLGESHTLDLWLLEF